MSDIIENKLGHIQQSLTVKINYGVYFTYDLFKNKNPIFRRVISSRSQSPAKVLFVLDDNLLRENPQLINNIKEYCNSNPQIFSPLADPLVLPGGEACKNDRRIIDVIIDSVSRNKICRHSYVVAIGGGALLDAAGYAAAIAHRGVRHIRIPTTVLSQNDSGVGVKNGINYFDKKNFIGTFSPPFAVINDLKFLETLEDRDWRSGISEAVKVALIKDENFFSFLEDASEKIVQRDYDAMTRLIHRCAELHMEHISSGDAFEAGSSRPLDFGHWAAHKLEFMTSYSLRHGEAVAIGIALDSTYSYLRGLLPVSHLERILNLLSNYGFSLFTPELKNNKEQEYELLDGIEEFREHLGGQLTVMLLEGIGKGVEVHSIDKPVMKESIKALEEYEQNKVLPEKSK